MHVRREGKARANPEVDRGLRGDLKAGQPDAEVFEPGEVREPPTGGDHRHARRDGTRRSDDPHSPVHRLQCQGRVLEAQVRARCFREAEERLDGAIGEDPTTVR